mgnify:CR=1 FL=1
MNKNYYLKTFVVLIFLVFTFHNSLTQAQLKTDSIFITTKNSYTPYSNLVHTLGQNFTDRNNPSIIDSSLYTAYKPWESEKHFWVGAGELAIVEFIPWALAKWIRKWDDPSKNWANVGFQSWWRNINNGWEYDGDSFLTNYFAHPYHGNLYFNIGRTNGYDFWESTAWAFAGSAIWEYFGEKYRPAFNDWINTSVNGINLGEMTYRLSTLITDNTASGSERFWSEVFGTILNPVRGFNRIISGEVSKTYPNPDWRKPEDFKISFSSGIRRIDKNGSKLLKEGVEDGVLGMDLNYGNPLKTTTPFSNFRISISIASSKPVLNKLESSGFLLGYQLKNSNSTKHRLNFNLEYGYYNIFKQDQIDSLKYEGILFGATSIYPHLISSFDIGSNSSILTQVGANVVLMGATPNDYYFDVEGRNYDFGPGVGNRIGLSFNHGGWDYIRLTYNGLWIWTMSEPADSKHHIHNLSLELQFPLNSYFAFGIGGNIYWRNSYYSNFENVYKEHPSIRIYFTTIVL